MSLYLCIFAEDREIAAVEVGGYADFNALRELIAEKLEGGAAGSRFPTLMLHSDCDGEWPVSRCKELRAELVAIIEALRRLPPVEFRSEWQKRLARSAGLSPRNALESFIDVEGEILLERLHALTCAALSFRQPILFQ